MAGGDDDAKAERGGAVPDAWRGLARLTPARIALGRAGPALPTRAVLAFALAHARARDAVHTALDGEALANGIAALGLRPLLLDSMATERRHYLSRPDHGRRLSPGSRQRLSETEGPADLALIIGDGLSAAAVMAHAVPMVAAVLPAAKAAGISVCPVVPVVRGARVAIADEIGDLLKARVAAILIGERPGLSSPDSLGAYMTFQPRPGRTDGERNCISNIRPEGLTVGLAAEKLIWLAREALVRGVSGVALKDESGTLLQAHSGSPQRAVE